MTRLASRTARLRSIEEMLLLSPDGMRAVDLAEEIFHMPVRIGSPQNVRGLKDIVNNPIYSTGVGLLLYGMEQQRGDGYSAVHSSESFWGKLKSLFQKNF